MQAVQQDLLASDDAASFPEILDFAIGELHDAGAPALALRGDSTHMRQRERTTRLSL